MKKWYSIEQDMINLKAHDLNAKNKKSAFAAHDTLWNSFTKRYQNLTDSFYLVYMEEPIPNPKNDDQEESRILAILDSLKNVRHDYKQKVRF